MNQSQVSYVPFADPKLTNQHYSNRLAVETDVSDVQHDLEHGVENFVLLDVRSKQHYDECHAKGAIHLSYHEMNEATLAPYGKDTLFVVYCWGPQCNAATKGAARLSELGFKVKEMLGGIEYWRKASGPVEGRLV
ncbi:rhodanese-like domain-containing protein [Aureibacillus halotolerans]|uniref:rhodanese-like domain-containing protein n=1 Tax=Aureibacillus halotolerans TaxID=1508390 RepID=UPI001FB61194|nr:rhodanese-like domain-containing protein [Aureibacillus halotolerans]